MVKAIALHGLELYVYAGEDLPQPVADADAANDSSLGATTPAPVWPNVRATGTAAPTITGPQQGQIHCLVIETGTQLPRLLEHFGLGSLKDLPAAKFGRVVRTLQKRRAAA